MQGPPRAYIAMVGAFGVLTAAAAAASLPTRLDDVAIFGVLVAMAAAAALVPVRFVRSEGTQGFTLEGGIFVALLLSAPTGLVPAVHVLASVIAHGIRSRDIAKTAFNGGRTGLETTAGALVFWLLAPANPSPTDLRSVAAVMTGAVVYELVSIAAMAELFHRMSEMSRLASAREVGRLSVLTFSVNTGYGIVLAAVALVSVAITALSALLMIGLYVGFRGYAAAVSNHRRAAWLNEVSHLLLDLPGDSSSLAGILRRLADVFGGTAGDLVAEDGDGFAHWQLRHGQVTVTALDELPRAGLLASAIARQEGILETRVDDSGTRRGSVAAPIGHHGHAVGAISLSDRRGLEPWDAEDAAVLGAVANELAVALDNVALFRQLEQKRARLEAESTKVNDILNAATDGIVFIQADGTVEAWNPAMARITGVSSDEAAGHPWFVPLRLRDADGVEMTPLGRHVMSRALAGDQGVEVLSLDVLHADGSWRRLACTSSSVRGEDGRHRGVVLVARDVTDERELDELKSDFIATVSHELRTPLTPLKGFLSTLQTSRSELSESQLTTIHRSMGSQLARLEALISDLLAVAELDHGRFDLQPEDLDLGLLVTQSVEVEAGDDLGRCTVEVEEGIHAMGDPVALVRIVRSLVSNALKHTEGIVGVRVGSRPDWVTVTVTDEGPGISSWDHQRVFGRFERLGDHLRRPQGPGLGLTIARALARRMGGDVVLESAIGSGSTFVLLLPPPTPALARLKIVSEG